MTARSVLIGLAGAVAICGFCFFNDFVIVQGMLVPHQLPPIVYGGLAVGVFVLGWAGRRLGRWFRFTAAEWAVMAGLWLIACGIPGWGLIQGVIPTAIMTHHYARVEPSWRSEEIQVVAEVPKQMLVDVSGDDGRVLDGYMVGLTEGGGHLPLRGVPWRAWLRPLAFWMPFLLALTVATYGLAVLVHRQWSKHEVLPYPISTFAHALLPTEGKTEGAVYHERSFWAGALLVVFILGVNSAAGWFPKVLISIPLRVDLRPLYDLLPFLDGPGYSYHLSFATLGLAYFLHTRVSLSIGLVPYAFMVVALFFARYGVALNGGSHVGGNYNTFMFAGGYLGLFLLMVYAGRHYYFQALRHSFRLGSAAAPPAEPVATGGNAAAAASGRTVDHQAVWGMRVFLIGTATFVGMLMWAGLDWLLALLFTAIAIITVTVISRAVAETGTFVFGTFFTPAPLLVGLMGHVAVGPRAGLIMSLASCALLLSPGWAPMAFLSQALRLSDLAGANVKRVAQWGVIVLLVGAPLALAVSLYWSYDRGAPTWSWPHYANRFPGRDLVITTHRLKAQGMIDQAQSLRGWKRLLHLAPNGPHAIAFLVVVILTVACGVCNLRFPKWPFHPIMFLFLGSFHGQWLSVSLLLGCGLKVVVTKYGGAAAYNRLKPLMIGLIAGSVGGALMPMAAGAVYYFVTGEKPPASRWFM